MLTRLMDGRAIPASELAAAAGVRAQTASGHLAKLTDSGLLGVTRQGRHRYYRLATPDVARMIEQILVVAGDISSPMPRHAPARQALATARTCYDHLAGRLGVGIAETLLRRHHIVLSEDSGELTNAGHEFLADLGIEPNTVPGKRAYCRSCLDWTERRPHIVGKLGAALADRFLERKWIERQRDSRALTITPAGGRLFRETFDLTL
ncbi:MAG: ArsR/SmtB family transcription factor [Xanthobacteraceae bacterium]